MMLFLSALIYAFGFFLANFVDDLPVGLSPGVVLASLILFLCSVFLCAQLRLSVGWTNSSLFRIDLAFLLFFYILYLHPYSLDYFGYIDASFNRFLDDVFFEEANAALLVAAISALFFSAGVFYKTVFSSVPSRIPGILTTNDDGCVVDQLFRLNNILGAAALLIFLGTGGLATLQGAYTGLASGDVVADGLNFIVSHFYCSAFALVFLVKGGGQYEKMACLLLGNAWALLLLGAGDRNSFLLLIATEFVAFGLFVRRIRVVWLLVAASVAYSGYNAVEYARSSGERSLSGVVAAIFEGKKDTSSFDESSFSLTTLTARASMQDVSVYEIPFAKFKVIGFAGVVPFSRRLFVTPGDPFISSSDVLSEIIIGQERTWSIGSGLFSDVAIDLGLSSVPLMFFLIGCLVGSIQRWARDTSSKLAWALYALAVPLFFEYPRYTLDFPVRNLVWFISSIWLVRATSGLWRRS